MLKIVLNDDKEIVEEVRAGVKANNGHCPCEIIPTPDNKCICRAFREKETEGYCHCKLYKKILVND